MDRVLFGLDEVLGKRSAIAGLLSFTSDWLHTTLINMMRIAGSIKARKNPRAISREIIIDEVTNLCVKEVVTGLKRGRTPEHQEVSEISSTNPALQA
ncbi:hypothetical protein AVEN_113546-1 [Araneus ventricosus]|uniref:Uncharacterized protein n=1 Tax=Araneus ventricosus TaxID=182803 RepID=A0A4Y2G2H7_ARAVE|nr:hypothetical protein AVEN_113546-1 [Araneus ventricosus]